MNAQKWVSKAEGRKEEGDASRTGKEQREGRETQVPSNKEYDQSDK